MIWIFALGIIALSVYHEGFRKVVAWLLGSAAFVFVVVVGYSVIFHTQL
jgi:hypothetical protein